MTSDEARKLVSAAGRELIARGLAARTWGNISCRIDERTVAVTPSGMAYDLITPDDIVLVDIISGVISGCRRPTSELLIHTELYKYDSGVNFIVHTHQKFATAIGLTGAKGLPSGIGIAAYALPGTQELADNVNTSFMHGFRTVLMPHHGAVFAGKDMETAFKAAEDLEKICAGAISCSFNPREPDMELLKRAFELMRSEFKSCAAGTSKYAIAAAEHGSNIPAQLDDAAMMFGEMIPPASLENALPALHRCGAALVKGIGVICAADDDNDAESKAVLAEKACLCYLHTIASGISAELNPTDIKTLRESYLNSYSRRLRGENNNGGNENVEQN